MTAGPPPAVMDGALLPETPVTRRGRALAGVVLAVPDAGTSLAGMGLVSVTWATGVTALCGADDVVVAARARRQACGRPR